LYQSGPKLYSFLKRKEKEILFFDHGGLAVYCGGGNLLEFF
jgi:hypothetical protein